MINICFCTLLFYILYQYFKKNVILTVRIFKDVYIDVHHKAFSKYIYLLNKIEIIEFSK